MNRANRHQETRTDRHDQTNRRTDDSNSKTMGEVSHTHPYSDNGAVNRPFQRGPIVAADGGERESYDEDEEEPPATENADAREEEDDENGDDQMKDVNHTPPHGASANPVFERGGKEEPVESEE